MPGIFTDNARPGPNPYTTGGFTVATGLTTVDSAIVDVVTPGANLGQVEFDLSYSGGNLTIKVMRRNYDLLTSLGDLTNLPTGVTAATTSGQSYDTTSHTHAMDHDHAASPASGTAFNRVSNTLALALQPAVTSHTHTVDLPNFVANVVANTAHTHTWSSIYEHQHTITNTQTDATMTELANGTNLSGVTLMIHAVGTE